MCECKCPESSKKHIGPLVWCHNCKTHLVRTRPRDVKNRPILKEILVLKGTKPCGNCSATKVPVEEICPYCGAPEKDEGFYTCQGCSYIIKRGRHCWICPHEKDDPGATRHIPMFDGCSAVLPDGSRVNCRYISRLGQKRCKYADLWTKDMHRCPCKGPQV